jgi:hypothetical protein
VGPESVSAVTSEGGLNRWCLSSVRIKEAKGSWLEEAVGNRKGDPGF